MATTTERPNYLAPDKISIDSVPIELVRPSSINPRKSFDPDKLAELAASVKEWGVLEPLLVRSSPPQPADSGFTAPYELIAGERRWRAAKLAGLAQVPIRNHGAIDDKAALQLAMIENLQRQDLDPIEEAEGFRALHDVAGMKQTAIAAAVHRSQPVIAGRIRLLELPIDVQDRIRAGEISPSHGVALAKFSPFPAIASKLAAAAAKGHWPSAELEKPVPGAQFLYQDDLIRQIRSYDFDTTVCKTNCPLDAYRHEGPQSWQDYICLRPDHYDQLKAEAMAAKNASQREEENKRRAAIRATLPPGTELADVPDLPRYQDLPGAELITTPPAGCTEACPCRSQALNYSGQPTTICTDSKRYQRLVKAEHVARNKVRRTHAKDLTKRLTEKVDALATIGRREIVLLASQVNNDQAYSFSKPGQAWTTASRRHNGTSKKLEDLTAWDTSHDGSQVAQIAIEAICLLELEQYADTGTYPGAPITTWYLGDITEDPK